MKKLNLQSTQTITNKWLFCFLLILSMSELKKEKRQQAGAKEKSLLTAERKNERERERGREKLWWKKRVGRARQITHFEKNNHAGHVFRVVFFHTWKNRHVDVLKNWHISNFTNEEGQSLNKITTTFFVELARTR